MNERGAHRSIYAAIVDDAEFQELSSDARLLFFILKLSLGVSGIDVIYSSTLIEKIGKTQRAVDAALKQLRDNDWIRTEKNVIWLRNGLRFEPSISLKNPKHIVAIQKHLRALPRLALVSEFARYYGIPMGIGIDTPSDTLPDTPSDTVGDTHSIPYGIQENREPEPEKDSQSSSSSLETARAANGANGAATIPRVTVPSIPNGKRHPPEIDARIRREKAVLAAMPPPGTERTDDD
jgi:hypothetical protein